MGFAVMLTRAERAGRRFLVPYMCRIAALAVFGALHHIFLFAGDILFSYAVTATALLVVLCGRTKWFLLAVALCVGGGFIPQSPCTGCRARRAPTAPNSPWACRYSATFLPRSVMSAWWS